MCVLSSNAANVLASYRRVHEPAWLPYNVERGLRFVASFAKGSPLCSTVRIQMGKETPLCLTYNIGEGLGCLQFFLASRIEED